MDYTQENVITKRWMSDELARRSAGAAPEKDVQILFLDDEESILDSIQRLFFREPYGVFTTSSVEEARQMLQKGKIKVVVSDQRMPSIQGVKFLQEVKEHDPNVIRILFTGYTDFSAAEEAINMGEVYRFISKPWKTTELVAAIRQSLDHYNLIVENRKLFDETRMRKDELEMAHKKLEVLYEVQKDFTSTVSHELRTPLASIKTAIDLVAQKIIGEINSDQEAVLGRAKRNVDRLKRLIDGILDLTKIESGKVQMNFAMNDLHQVIQEVVDAQKEVAKKRGLTIETKLDPNVPRMSFDSDRLIQVLNNLIGNAFKFTKQGGVAIETQAKPEENHVLVSVIDTGKGIAEKDMSKLFQKFQQIEAAEANEEGGTGLGLAICRQIINQHKGKIWAESQPGKGTVFHFILPIQERRKI